MLIPDSQGKIPFVTADQMIEVDRAMIEDFKIELIQMMENAGRNLAHLARLRFLDGDPVAKKVVVLAGTGGNGGGALVCARRLHNYGAQVTVYTTKPLENFREVPAHQLEILERMNLNISFGQTEFQEPEPVVLIDGLIGYSLRGAPHGTAAALIEWANNQEKPILSLDAPSGVDTTSGLVYQPAIRVAATMTLALPKEGLRAPGVEQNVGELYLADISVPPELYSSPALGLEVGPIFAQSDLIRIW